MHYSGQVAIHPSEGSLDAELHVSMTTSKSTLVFLLSGGLELAEVTGKDVQGFDSEPMEPGATWDRITVRLKPTRGTEDVTLTFRYGGQPVMPQNGINQISSDWVELTLDSAWHPILATLAHQFTLDISVDLPTNWSFVTSGNAVVARNRWHITNQIPQTDIAFVAAPGLSREERGGYVVYHRDETPDTVNAVLDAALACRAYLDSRFGEERPLPDGRFVITSRETGGFARKNFISLTRVAGRSKERLTAFLCHELAHFWSTGARPLSVENWLNESFAVFVAARATREMFGEQAYKDQLADWRKRAAGQPSIWTPEDSTRRPFEVNYKKGPLALHRLAERIGEERFSGLLREYMTAPINTTPALLDALERRTNAETRKWFESVLAENEADP